MCASDILSEDISDDFYKAVGRIVVAFNDLEFQISFLISVLVGLEYSWIPEVEWCLKEEVGVGKSITAQLGFKNAMWLLGAVAKIRFNSRGMDLSELDEIMKRAWKAEKKRNEVVHSTWLVGPGFPQAVRSKFTARGQLKSQYESKSVKDLDSIADFIDELTKDVYQFIVSIISD